MKFRNNDITWKKKRIDGVAGLVVTVNNDMLERNSLATTNFQPHFLQYTATASQQETEFIFNISGLESFSDYHRRGSDTPEQLWRLRLLALDLSNNFFPKLFPIFKLEYMFVSPDGGLWLVGIPLRREAVQNKWIAELTDDFDLCQQEIMRRKTPTNREKKKTDGVSFLGGLVGFRSSRSCVHTENTTETLGESPMPIVTQPVNAQTAEVAGYSVGLVCDIGDVKQSNQDRVLIRTGSYNGVPYGVFLVADGMGGMSHGEVASSMVAQRISEWYDKHFMASVYSNDMSTAMRSLDDAITSVNNDIISFAQQQGERVGTTLTLCTVLGNDYIIRHVGDSRVYYYVAGQLNQLTKDHSFVASELEKGNITPEEAVNHPRKNVLTQCIGVHRTVDVFQTSGVFSMRQGGFILVCSDGFHNYFPWEQLGNILPRYTGDNLQELTEEMRAWIVPGGAKDNVSCVVVAIPAAPAK